MARVRQCPVTLIVARVAVPAIILRLLPLPVPLSIICFLVVIIVRQCLDIHIADEVATRAITLEL